MLIPIDTKNVCGIELAKMYERGAFSKNFVNAEIAKQMIIGSYPYVNEIFFDKLVNFNFSKDINQEVFSSGKPLRLNAKSFFGKDYFENIKLFCDFMNKATQIFNDVVITSEQGINFVKILLSLHYELTSSGKVSRHTAYDCDLPSFVFDLLSTNTYNNIKARILFHKMTGWKYYSTDSRAEVRAEYANYAGTTKEQAIHDNAYSLRLRAVSEHNITL
jgi:hypothetical protein